MKLVQTWGKLDREAEGTKQGRRLEAGLHPKLCSLLLVMRIPALWAEEGQEDALCMQATSTGGPRAVLGVKVPSSWRTAPRNHNRGPGWSTDRSTPLSPVSSYLRPLLLS